MFKALLLFAVICHSGLGAGSGSESNKTTSNESISGLSEANSVSEESKDLDLSSRIFGGITPNTNDYQFVARLFITYSSRATSVCSGVVLTDKVILTVAHCLNRPGGERAASVRVSLQRGFYIFNKDEIFVHPEYQETYAYDVAILRKDTQLQTYMRNFGIPPIITPQSQIIPTGSAIIAGWGRTSGKSTLNVRRLQVARIDLGEIPDGNCNGFYSDIADSMNPFELICSEPGATGICAGDWGGPLLKNDNNRLTLIGLNMFKLGDCKNIIGLPSAFFNVAVVSEWISNTIRPLLRRN